MSKLFNLARMTSATAGTGTLTLGAAVSGYLTFALAGVTDGTWVTYGIKDGSNSEVGYGKYTAAGTTLSRTAVISSTNGNALISCSGAQEVYVTAAPSDYTFLDNYITGLTLSNDGVSPNTVLDIAAGCAADSTNTDLIRLTSAFTKTTGAWAAGTGNGGLDTGAVAASTWYHVYVIRRQDTGATDVLFSLSASAPTLPTNYTQFRRIGSFKTNGSSQIAAFFQNADTFLWSAMPALDYNQNNPGTAAVSVTLGGVPTGVRVEAILNAEMLNAGSVIGPSWLLSSLDVANTAPGDGVSPLGTIVVNPTSAIKVGTQVRVWTNTSAQIRSRVSASSTDLTLYVQAIGWVDSRGKFG